MDVLPNLIAGGVMKMVNFAKSFIGVFFLGACLPASLLMAEAVDEDSSSAMPDADSLVCGTAASDSADSDSGYPLIATSKNLAVAIPLDANFSSVVNPILSRLWSAGQEPVFVTHAAGYFVLILHAQELPKSVKGLLLNGLMDQKLSASCLAAAKENILETSPTQPGSVAAVMSDYEKGHCAVTGSTCDIFDVVLPLGMGMALALDLPADAF